MEEKDKAGGALRARSLTDSELAEVLRVWDENSTPWLMARDLREARRLLGQTHRDYCRATCPGRWDEKRWVPGVHEATCQDVAHFLGEQSEPDRSDNGQD